MLGGAWGLRPPDDVPFLSVCVPQIFSDVERAVADPRTFIRCHCRMDNLDTAVPELGHFQDSVRGRALEELQRPDRAQYRDECIRQVVLFLRHVQLSVGCRMHEIDFSFRREMTPSTYWHTDGDDRTLRNVIIALSEPALHTRVKWLQQPRDFVQKECRGDGDIGDDMTVCPYADVGSATYFESTACHASPHHETFHRAGTPRFVLVVRFCYAIPSSKIDGAFLERERHAVESFQPDASHDVCRIPAAKRLKLRAKLNMWFKM